MKENRLFHIFGGLVALVQARLSVKKYGIPTPGGELSHFKVGQRCQIRENGMHCFFLEHFGTKCYSLPHAGAASTIRALPPKPFRASDSALGDSSCGVASVQQVWRNAFQLVLSLSRVQGERVQGGRWVLHSGCLTLVGFVTYTT